MSDSDIQELARKIYRNHKAAIDLIVEAKPDAQQQIREMVVEQSGTHPEIVLDLDTKSYIQFHDPRWDDFSQLNDGNSWSGSGLILFFQFQNSKDSLRLHLIIGPGPDDIRERLFDEAVRTSGIFKPSRKILPKTWASIYQKSVLRKKDYESLETLEWRSRIDLVLENVVNDDLDPIFEFVKKSLA